MEKAAKWIDATINILCAVLAGFVIYTAVFGVMTAVIQRGLVLGATLVVTFLQLIKKDIQKKSKITWISTVYFLFILAAVAMTIYIVATFKLTVERAGAYTQMDIIMSIAVFLVLIIAAQRSLGWPMIIISLVFLAYTLFGRYIPGSFGHRGYAISRIMPYLSLGTEGIFGTSMGVASRRYRDLFGFGALMERFGIGDYFITVAYGLVGRSKGGSAKASIVASALMGTVSGSARSQHLDDRVLYPAADDPVRLQQKNGGCHLGRCGHRRADHAARLWAPPPLLWRRCGGFLMGAYVLRRLYRPFCIT